MRPTVLVVEPLHASALSVGKVVAEVGFRVDHASEARRALAKLVLGHLPSVVLLGVDTLQEQSVPLRAEMLARRDLAEVPALLYSTARPWKRAAMTRRLRCHGHVALPLTASSLRRVLDVVGVRP